MARCEVCGNDYGMSFEVHAQGAILLTAIARCNRCGGGLKGHPKWKKGERTPGYNYNCNKQRPEHCGALSIDGPNLDSLIQELVWAQVLRASQQKRVPETAEPWAGEAALKDVEERFRSSRISGRPRRSVPPRTSRHSMT
jgi:hypothetical protein